jgi:hypothetical protein
LTFSPHHDQKDDQNVHGAAVTDRMLTLWRRWIRGLIIEWDPAFLSFLLTHVRSAEPLFSRLSALPADRRLSPNETGWSSFLRNTLGLLKIVAVMVESCHLRSLFGIEWTFPYWKLTISLIRSERAD